MQKFYFLGGNLKRSGTILLSVLWILVILAILIASLGRNANVELSLVKHSVSKMKSRYLAWAGVVYAKDRIRQDSEGEESKTEDILYRCGVRLEESESAEEAFSNRELADGYFDVAYVSEGKDTFYGIQDEERRININALSVQNYNVLSSLITILGFDEQSAQTIAYSVLDWKDEDDTPTETTYGAEKDFYESQAVPYKCKNRLFDSKEELLLVRGMTTDIYKALKDYVTVFPKQGILRVNFDTASEEVLTSLARAINSVVPSAGAADVEALVGKILQYRQGEDGMIFTSDDRRIELNEMPLNAQERDLFLAMSQFRTYTSDYLRIRVQGFERTRGAQTVVEAVVNRNDLTTLQWQRE